MLKLLVDTSVWLNLAKNFRETPTLDALEDLIEARRMELIVPQISLDEFARNKSRVIEEAKRGLQGHFRLVREAVDRFAEGQSKSTTLQALNEVDHRIALGDDSVIAAIGRIEALLGKRPAIAASAEIKRRVTERALAGLAPYHRAKNSVGDAIIIETYAAALEGRKGKKTRFGFVTHNFKDFSEPNGDQRTPHPDLVRLFKAGTSRYFISLVDAIKTVDPDLLEDHTSEFDFVQQPRKLSQILEQEQLLFRQVWYNRHWNLRVEIESGEHQVVPKARYSTKPYRSDQTLDTVWQGALSAAKRTEDEVGVENLGPWDDFEWGMINGKLSALRWVLGDEWDMLDT